MNTNAPADFNYYAPYLNQPAVRAALHVGNVTFPNAPSTCEKHLLPDFMVRCVSSLEPSALWGRKAARAFNLCHGPKGEAGATALPRVRATVHGTLPCVTSAEYGR